MTNHLKKAERVHIVGSGPRCGTTLLFEAMKVCFEFDAAPEHEAPICQSRYDFAPHGRILTKYPGEIDLMRWPLRLDPRLSVICIIRDPRDMVVSTHGGRPGLYWASLKFWRLFLNHIDTLEGHPRFMMLRYEDLVASPDEAQNKLSLRFPGLVKKHPFSRYHEHAAPSALSVAALKGVRPIRPIGVGSWRCNLARVKQQIHLHGSISDSLIRFQYEPDRAWETMLEDELFHDFETATGEFFEQDFGRKRFTRNSLAALRNVVELSSIPSNRVLSPFRWAYRKIR